MAQSVKLFDNDLAGPGQPCAGLDFKEAAHINSASVWTCALCSRVVPRTSHASGDSVLEDESGRDSEQ